MKNITSKPRVGILTWHFYDNAGSFLQALALQHVIELCGYSVKIIDYRKNFHYKGIKRCLWRIFERLFFLFPDFLFPRYAMKYYLLQRKYMKLVPCNSLSDLLKTNKIFDTFVCGSDQIWAPNVLDNAYLLSFVEDEKKRIAYAPSIGLPLIPERLKSIYASNISKFQSVSVREKHGAELLKREFCISAQVVLDPTLLLTGEEWDKLIKIPVVKESSYVFCYFLGKNSWQVEFAKKIAEKEGKKLFIMSPHSDYSNYADRYWNNLTPDYFIGFLRNADKVLTDSFHGMAFSVNFKKDFLFFHRFAVADPVNQNSRVDSLADLLGLQGRLVVEDMQNCNHPAIDFKAVFEKLQAERQKSISYLEKALAS